ncbi:glycosyltransferase family 87 protein [Methylobacterium persicinum]|uniref:DUF2029 domain-containing protein n=1 Tax=Methylobacterium persicinum TaxID=374426 RepID=A0ABU0HH49_9HYPH|nr:glycosyltransferase family 87 protein [Methylobacterium persicinum]MDQ0441654.1 hypothetical protein [Methylobacterium persicinum]GJE39416.1 hypothetical protein KHHGKMAE_3498 [Methylobacterium persicinum]
MTTQIVQRRQLAVLAGGGVVSAASWLLMAPWNVHGWFIGAPLGRDFVNFWLAPRLVMAGQGAMLIDLPAYAETIRATFGLARDPGLLFVYPPHAMLLFAPFSMLPFLPAVLLWTAFNLACLALATRLLLRGAPARGILLAVCLSPPAVAMMMYGHFGGLLALATTVAVLEAPRRPLLAGLCMAILSMKPQFACAIGLMLFCAGQWRCLVFGVGFSLVLAVVSAGLFGIEVWQRFVMITMPMQSSFVTGFDAKMIETAVTAYFAARYSGVAAPLAWAIQGVVAAVSLACGVAALRRGAGEPGCLLVVVLGALVMQPYVSHYDLAIAAPALTLVVLGREPGAAPVTVAAWLLTPLARLLIVFDMPILGVLVPGALIAQGFRLLGPKEAEAPRQATLDAAA